MRATNQGDLRAAKIRCLLTIFPATGNVPYVPLRNIAVILSCSHIANYDFGLFSRIFTNTQPREYPYRRVLLLIGTRACFSIDDDTEGKFNVFNDY